LRTSEQVVVQLQDLKISNNSDQAQERLEDWASAGSHQTISQQREPPEPRDRLMQLDLDEDEDGEITPGLDRRDTEARMEGRGEAFQSGAERAATWQCESLQDLPEAHRLRRRFT